MGPKGSRLHYGCDTISNGPKPCCWRLVLGPDVIVWEQHSCEDWVLTRLTGHTMIVQVARGRRSVASTIVVTRAGVKGSMTLKKNGMITHPL